MEQKAELTSVCLSAAAPEVWSQRGVSLKHAAFLSCLEGRGEKSGSPSALLPPLGFFSFAEMGESISLFEARSL